MAACTCSTLTEFALNCTPTIGGIASVTIDAVAVQVLPETGTVNSVMTYDKTKNVKYWTTDVSVSIGNYSTTSKDLSDSLACPVGHSIVITMNSGATITVADAFIQTATFNDGPTKADASVGVLSFQAITKLAPAVTNPA